MKSERVPVEVTDKNSKGESIIAELEKRVVGIKAGTRVAFPHEQAMSSARKKIEKVRAAKG